MQSKLYLLLVILSTFVLCSISTEQKPRKNDSSIDSKKKVGAYDKEDHHPKDNYNDDDDDEITDHHPSLSSYADNRYSPSSQGESNYRLSPYADRYSTLNLGEGNYRTRSRWPAQSQSSSSSFLSSRPSSSVSLEDLLGENDWSRSEYSNAFPSSSPSVAYDSNPMTSGNPTCHSLVDSQYPIFADTCGAVPQARYSLPNSFGHRERWHIAQVLTSLVGSSTDPACTRSLRLLLCPVLFPPCPSRHEPPPVLPCQSYCRAVKARCAIPTLDLLPCEALPYSSDLCPTNQAYGSFVPPAAAYPSVSQPSPSSYSMSRSFPSLQSLLSTQGLQSTLTPSSLPSASSSSPQPTVPVNLYNSGSYATESLSPTSADFPTRSYTNDYRQASVYGPLTWPSTETRSATDVRPSTAARLPAAVRSAAPARPSAISSVVKA